MPRRIYLIPSPLSKADFSPYRKVYSSSPLVFSENQAGGAAKIAGKLSSRAIFLPATGGIDQIKHLRTFLVEEPKSARRFLKRMDPALELQSCTFLPLNEHTRPEAFTEYLEKISGDIGIISGAGCPCVADPGAEAVLLAHQKGWEVVPLAGSSSIILALMASGLNGQNFAFNGYLPRERFERIKKIKALEARSFHENQTQIFIETPYRNQALFDDILASCFPETWMCVAVDLTGHRQSVRTVAVKEWQLKKFTVLKHPAIFLILRRSPKSSLIRK